jgi:hypothetical protein
LAVTSGVGDVTGIVKDHMLCNQPSVYFWECKTLLFLALMEQNQPMLVLKTIGSAPLEINGY